MKRIGIIGGGFSGTMTAIHLIRQASGPLALTLCDLPARMGRGLAYSTHSPRHLLNVPAAGMSAFAGAPLHFLEWVLQSPEYKDIDRNVLADAFLPRGLYGHYLSVLQEEALREAGLKGISVRILPVQITALAVEAGEVILTPAEGAPVVVDACVLAVGNPPPVHPGVGDQALRNRGRYVADPWDPAATACPDATLPVLVLGNGLSMVDALLELRGNGFSGPVHTLSPHGFHLMPHPPKDGFSLESLTALWAGKSFREVAGRMRKERNALKDKGICPSRLVDSLRPHTQRLWQGMDLPEKQRFLKSLQPAWNAARHRVSRPVYEALRREIDAGTLVPHAGVLTHVEETPDALHIDFRLRNGEKGALAVSRIINCSRSETRPEHTANPLLRQGFAQGLLAPDPLRLGLHADPATFRLYDASGQLHPQVYTLGPPLKGMLWESTAVRELREQAESLAAILLAEEIQDSWPHPPSPSPNPHFCGERGGKAMKL